MGSPKNTEEYLKEWEDIINTVDKTSFPLCFVSSVSFESELDLPRTIDIQELRDKGYDDVSIIEIITETILEKPLDNEELEFNLDIPSIAKKAQKETNRILKNLPQF